jgi:YVTN family beta-propeller protein
MPLPSPTTAPEPPADKSLVLATIPFSAQSAPESIAVGFGSVWVITHHSDTLFRIDPATNQVIASIKIEVPGQEIGVGSVVVGAHGVWVPVNFRPDSQLWRIDPATNQVTLKIPTVDAGGLADWTEAMWVDIDPQIGAAIRRQIVQIDPDTGKTLRTVDLGPALISPRYTTDLKYGLGSVWVVVDNNELARVDPSTGRVIATIMTPGVPSGYATLAFAGNDVFVAQGDNTVARVDGGTNCVDGVAYLGARLRPDNPAPPPLAIFTAPGGLYVSFDRGALALLDAAQLTVRRSVRFDVQNAAGTPAFGFGSIWFPTFKNDTVLRVQPLG